MTVPAQREKEPQGYIDLLCEECSTVYSALHPPMSEIEWPVCPSCRNGYGPSKLYPLSRAD